MPGADRAESAAQPLAPEVAEGAGTPARAEVEALLYREARLLDERRFEEWLALFTPDGRYLIPAGDTEDPEVEPAIADDDHDTLEDRIHRLRSPVTWAQSPPSRTVHVVGGVEVWPGLAPAECRVHATAVVYESRGGQTRSFAARCLYVLRRVEERDTPWRIALKRVLLVNRDQPLFNLTFLL